MELATQTATTSSTLVSTKVVQAALLQEVQVKVESVHFVQIANPWPHHTA